MRWGRIALTLVATLGITPARAEERPPVLREVAFDQRLGTQVPLDVPFVDDAGRRVTLRAYTGKPVLLVPAYYTCPMLCTLVLNGVVSALRALPFDVGAEFTVVTYSFDPADGPEAAATKKATALSEYRRAGADAGWHYLTGDATSIAAVSDAIGFRSKWDDTARQFAHASGIVLLTPDGRVARYFFGVEFAPRDLRLAIVEASSGKIGTLVDALLLFCFHYDPSTGRYSAVALNAVRVGGLLTLLGMGLVIAWWLRRERPGEAAA